MKIEPLMFPTRIINEEKCHLHEPYPVFHFSIKGRLPHKDVDRQTYVKARDYFLKQVMQSYDWDQIDIRFEHAMVYVAQYFKSSRIRDLDNLSKKPLIDAVRSSLLTADDSFHFMSHAEDGFVDGKSDHIEVFVMERKHFWAFDKWWALMGLEALGNEVPRETVKRGN